MSFPGTNPTIFFSPKREVDRSKCGIFTLPFSHQFQWIWFCPSGSDGKESSCNAEDPGSIPGSGRFPWRRDRLPTLVFLGFPGKESSCNAGDTDSIPGSGGSPGGENGNALYYSCPENPMDRGARWTTIHGAVKSSRGAKSWTQLADFHFLEYKRER